MSMTVSSDRHDAERKKLQEPPHIGDEPRERLYRPEN
jgi:hypothetical protein